MNLYYNFHGMGHSRTRRFICIDFMHQIKHLWGHIAHIFGLSVSLSESLRVCRVYARDVYDELYARMVVLPIWIGSSPKTTIKINRVRVGRRCDFTAAVRLYFFALFIILLVCLIDISRHSIYHIRGHFFPFFPVILLCYYYRRCHRLSDINENIKMKSHEHSPPY